MNKYAFMNTFAFMNIIKTVVFLILSKKRIQKKYFVLNYLALEFPIHKMIEREFQELPCRSSPYSLYCVKQ